MVVNIAENDNFRQCLYMPNKQKQRVKKKPADASSISNRQSYDPQSPVDIHTQPIDYLTEPEVKKLIVGGGELMHV